MHAFSKPHPGYRGLKDELKAWLHEAHDIVGLRSDLGATRAKA